MIIRLRSNTGVNRLTVPSQNISLQQLLELIQQEFNIGVELIELAYDLEGNRPIDTANNCKKTLSELGINAEGFQLFLSGKYEKKVVEKAFVGDDGEVVKAGTTLVRLDAPTTPVPIAPVTAASVRDADSKEAVVATTAGKVTPTVSDLGRDNFPVTATRIATDSTIAAGRNGIRGSSDTTVDVHADQNAPEVTGKTQGSDTSPRKDTGSDDSYNPHEKADDLNYFVEDDVRAPDDVRRMKLIDSSDFGSAISLPNRLSAEEGKELENHEAFLRAAGLKEYDIIKEIEERRDELIARKMAQSHSSRSLGFAGQDDHASVVDMMNMFSGRFMETPLRLDPQLESAGRNPSMRVPSDFNDFIAATEADSKRRKAQAITPSTRKPIQKKDSLSRLQAAGLSSVEQVRVSRSASGISRTEPVSKPTATSKAPAKTSVDSHKSSAGRSSRDRTDSTGSIIATEQSVDNPTAFMKKKLEAHRKRMEEIDNIMLPQSKVNSHLVKPPAAATKPTQASIAKQNSTSASNGNGLNAGKKAASFKNASKSVASSTGAAVLGRNNARAAVIPPFEPSAFRQANDTNVSAAIDNNLDAFSFIQKYESLKTRGGISPGATISSQTRDQNEEDPSVKELMKLQEQLDWEAAKEIQEMEEEQHQLEKDPKSAFANNNTQNRPDATNRQRVLDQDDFRAGFNMNTTQIAAELFRDSLFTGRPLPRAAQHNANNDIDEALLELRRQASVDQRFAAAFAHYDSDDFDVDNYDYDRFSQGNNGVNASSTQNDNVSNVIYDEDDEQLARAIQESLNYH